MDQLSQFFHTIYTGAITSEIGLGFTILNTILIIVMMITRAQAKIRDEYGNQSRSGSNTGDTRTDGPEVPSVVRNGY